MAKTVLIADDILFVRKTLAAILTEAHFQVVGEAVNGNDAVQQYAKLKPDLVTMDIVMPELSGIEATRRIMRIEKLAKVIIISAMGQENLVMEAINAGAKDFIQKPFTAEEVVKTATRVLSNEGSSGTRKMN